MWTEYPELKKETNTYLACDYRQILSKQLDS